MKDNVILLGLKNDHNLGDKVICDCMGMHLKKALPTQVQLRVIDLGGTELDIPLVGRAKIIRKSILFAEQLLKIRGTGLLIGRKNKSALMRKIVFAKLTNAAQHLYNENTKCVIFAGGGLIKYKQQYCYLFLNAFISEADKRNIPVMLSGVGVEDYDETNADCMMLKRSLNLPCVKMITTRDDIDRLKKNYAMRSDLICKLVADPACSVSDFIPAPTAKRENRKIGLGVVRGTLFESYGIAYNEKQLLSLWESIIKELDSRNYDWQIFTNGVEVDQIFAKKLSRKLDLSSDKVKNRPETTEALIDVITDFDALIVCRLHASIIAYSYNIPAIGLVWNNKQKMFGEAIKHSERFIERKQFIAKHIVDTLEQSMAETDVIADKRDYMRTTYNELSEFLNSL